jgi:ACDE family multidrug resistance protein
MAAPSSQRTLVILCLASCGWAFSFGLGATLASPFLSDAGYDKTTIGLNTSIYYLGVAVAALALPWLMRKSSRTCIVAGMLTDALTVALFPWAGGPVGWFGLRLLGGAATALSVIPMETMVNHNAPPARRARDFGLYAFSVALGVGLGPVAGLPLYPIAPKLAFAIGGLAALLAAALAWLGLPARNDAAEEESRPPRLSVAANGLSFGTAWIQGFLEGGMITFLSVYLLGLNYTDAAAGLLIGVLFLGVIAFQVPGAWLADRLGRVRVLLACHGVVLIGMLGLPLHAGPVWLSVWLFLIGACCAALYPLGLAVLGERAPRAALGKANAWYLASNCAGSLSGPVVMGLVVEWWGWHGLFTAGTIAVALVTIAGTICHRLLGRRHRSPGRPGDQMATEPPRAA